MNLVKEGGSVVYPPLLDGTQLWILSEILERFTLRYSLKSKILVQYLKAGHSKILSEIQSIFYYLSLSAKWIS